MIKTADIKFIAGDGTGDYNCDGFSDQYEINEALLWAAENPGSRIHLTGPFAYDLTDQLYIGSSTIFSGDPTAKLKLNNGCLWPAMKPVIGQLEGRGAATHDIEIYGFEVDLNQTYLYSTDRIHGKGFYNTLFLEGSPSNPAYNISIHDVYWHDGLGDGPRFECCKNISIYNCDFRNLMHASVYLIDSENIEIKNNHIEAITNAGVRFDNCRNAVASNNTITDFTGTTYAPKAGAHGFQIGNQPANYGRTGITQNIELYNNNISVGACAIALNDAATTGLVNQVVYIHNNLIKSCGKTNWTSYFCGIAFLSWGNGIIIENNTFDSNYRAGIIAVAANASGARAVVRNNNIVNTVKLDGDGGYGIWNKIPSTFTIIPDSNYLGNNVASDYRNVVPGSYAVESIPEATLIPEPAKNYKIVLKCLESEVEKISQDLTQKYLVYKKA